MLEVLNVSKSFGGVKAVNDCSFKVRKGSITALIGPNGSGKTTIFNIVCGVLKPDSGKVLLKGKNIAGKNPEEISNNGISRLFQQPRLFSNLTVEENLLLALNNEDLKFWKNLAGKNKKSKQELERVGKVLEKVRMLKFKERLARELSFGQKRLVELARTMLNPHELLMLDEPVAGVNPALRKEIAKTLKELQKQGETILLIEHDLNFTLGLSDTAIVLEEGKVIAEGKPSKIRRDKKVLEAYLGD